MPVLIVVVATLSPAPTTLAQETRAIRPAEPQAHLQLDELLSIGSLSGEYDAFGRVADIALDLRCRVLVADRQGAHFKAFDPSGAYLATVGRRGEGPGEFASPSGIAVGPGDSIFVGDTERGLISVFSPEYEWVRDVRISPAWQVNSMIPRPDGTLVVAAFSPGDSYPVKVLGPDGTILRRAGVPIDAPNLYGFEASLLGGRLTQDGSDYVHTMKSPYMLSFLDERLDPIRVCHGPRDFTTDPAEVVDVYEDGVGIRWGAYRHSVSILTLGNGIFLNAFLDPGDDWTLLHVVNESCELVAELELAASVTPKVARGNLVVAARRTDYHEVVVYRVSLEGGAEDSR